MQKLLPPLILVHGVIIANLLHTAFWDPLLRNLQNDERETSRRLKQNNNNVIIIIK